MTPARTVATTLALAAAMLGACDPASARRLSMHHPVDSYSSFTLGVYSPRASGAPDGLFGGLEFGLTLSSRFEIGIEGDYMYRARRAGGETFPDPEAPYEVPVEATIDGTVSTVHLGMIGLTGRLRLPMATRPGRNRAPIPFLEGGLLAQVLHLSSTERTAGDPYIDDHERSDTFAGLGWLIGGGVEIPLDSRVGLLTEAGYVFAEPTKTIEEPGYPSITYEAQASGVYLRGGVRVAY